MPNLRYGSEIFEECVTCTWRSAGFLGSLAPSTLKAFDAISLTNVFPEGACLYAEGQPSRGVFVVCRGTAKLSISSTNARTIITGIVGPGDVLGLSSLVSGKPYNSTATTLEPSQLSFVRRDALLKLIETHPEPWASVARALARECETNADHIRALELSRTAAEKLAYLILSWCEVDGTSHASACRVRMLMTHEHVAQLIGTTRETVTRLLKDFRRRKMIMRKGSTLIVPDRAALESLVHVWVSLEVVRRSEWMGTAGSRLLGPYC